MDLPIYVYLVFGLTVFSAILLFYKATNFSKSFLTLIIVWIIFQTIISILGFYKIANTIPPRFGLLIIPPLILTIIRFNTKRGKQFIDNLNIKTLTLFHTLRIPVELVLYWLFIHKAVPELMTFEGRNFDIFSGVTAPLVYYFGFVRKSLSRNILLLWNFICLALLFNIAFNAILSLPSAFQQFAFDQPNIAILHFPFVLLPSVLVPLVLFSHLASIRQLLYNKNI
ncbi:MAG: hypothetical protein ABL929_02700 [Ferruginibacter sp.]|nr:hypothetical protein [Ferruginibacter sp.]